MYATYARGYKPKVYNSSTRLTSNDPLSEPVDKKEIDHFELGSKGAYMKGHLIINTSVFDTIYKHFQVQVWNTSEFIPVLELKSAGEAETRGIELDLSAVPTQDLKINLSAAYIDSKFNKFKNADNFPTQTAEKGATALGQDLSGKPMPDSPKFKTIIGVEQRIIDVKDAIRFVRKHVDLYGVDPDRLPAWGLSAGGNLATMAGTTCQVDDFNAGTNDPDVSSCVQAAVVWFGLVDFTKGKLDEKSDALVKFLGCNPCSQALRAKANPFTYVTDNTPPFLIMQGDLETGQNLPEDGMKIWKDGFTI